MSSNNISKSEKTNILKRSVEARYPIPIRDLVKPASPTDPKRPIDPEVLRAMMSRHRDQIEDNEGIMAILPDLKIARETLSASIISPKDLQSQPLNIKVHKTAPPLLAETVREHFCTEYDLNSAMTSILENALFNKGAHVTISLSPGLIHNIIQENTISMESEDSISLPVLDSKKAQFPNIGLIKKNNNNLVYALEGVDAACTPAEKNKSKTGNSIQITDNLRYLATPIIRKLITKSSVTNLLKTTYSLEGTATKDVYGIKSTKVVPIQKLSYDTVTSELNPVVFNFAPESVIPVIRPGDPEDAVGYYIFLDEENSPIYTGKLNNRFQELNRYANEAVKNQALMGSIGTSLNYNGGYFMGSLDENQALLNAYYTNLEETLINAVKEGAGNQTVELANPGEIYKVSFMRQLRNQRTRVLYVPKEICTYMAFNYDDTGRGVSLLELTKLASAFRAVIMFATVIGSLKNSLSLRLLDITLDEADPDPQTTIETIYNEYMLMQTSAMQIPKLNPVDLMNIVQQAGIEVNINGGDKFPGTSVAVSEIKRDVMIPSQDLADMLKDIQYAGLGISREVIEKSTDIDFAVEVVTTNKMQARRDMSIQKPFMGFLADIIKKYIFAGGPLYTKIKGLYDEFPNSDLTLEQIINSIEVSLPQPDTSVLSTQMADYKTYSDFLDEVMPDIIDETMLKDMLHGDNISPAVENVKAAFTSLIKRRYLSSENMLPELTEMLNNEDDLVSDLISRHNEAIVAFVGKISRFVSVAEKNDDILTNATNKILTPDDEQEGSDNSSDDENTEGTEEEGDTDDIGEGDNVNEEETDESEDEGDEEVEEKVDSDQENESNDLNKK